MRTGGHASRRRAGGTPRHTEGWAGPVTLIKDVAPLWSEVVLMVRRGVRLTDAQNRSWWYRL